MNDFSDVATINQTLARAKAENMLHPGNGAAPLGKERGRSRVLRRQESADLLAGAYEIPAGRNGPMRNGERWANKIDE